MARLNLQRTQHRPQQASLEPLTEERTRSPLGIPLDFFDQAGHEHTGQQKQDKQQIILTMRRSILREWRGGEERG